MKLNPVNFLIALALSAVIAYGFWSIDGGLKNYVAIGAFVFLSGTLVPAMGISYALARRAINLRAVCFSFTLIALILNGIFSIFFSSETAYIIVSMIAFLVYAFTANLVYGTQQ
jgi:hypothetical protein